MEKEEDVLPKLVNKFDKVLRSDSHIRKTCSDLIYLGYFFCLILLKDFSG